MKTCTGENKKVKIPDIRKYRDTAILIAIICFVIGTLTFLVAANIIETQIYGHGDIYVRDASSRGTVDIAGASGTLYIYNYKREWDEVTNTGSSEFIIYGAKGGYQDQYRIKAVAAGHTVQYDAYNITGDFTGSREFSIILKDNIGENFDNLILLKGNATVTGRIRTGRMSLEDLFAVGEIALRSYINVSDTIQTPEDWLSFCEEISKRGELLINQSRT